mgnify:CR=1 FL=1|jgi:uncharacterized protein YcbK (DUF882 family)|tara:strand:- start:3595 stop:3951 length:357 start_codon:yes stop_codon:yes gene_type:complete
MTYKYFTLKEFDCKCGCGDNKIDPTLIEMLEEARAIADIPFVLSSAYRCPKHPESIKNPTSSHIKGLAVDIKCSESKPRAIILDALAHVGFRRFGLHKAFIHTDIDVLEKANPVIWLY